MLPKIIPKPWGREIWFAHTAKYAGKILEVKKGARLSLQYHERKSETQYLYEGKILLTIGRNPKRLKKKILKPGMAVNLKPGTIHRLEGMAPLSKIFEVSTPELDDVVKLADDYGRRGKGNNFKLDQKLARN
jgi:mannose-6-phosphate isomerase-like protein (cupin superfamily)